MGLDARHADVHLEADIHAIAGNKNGFGAGGWIPYLTINYTLVNLDTHKTQTGTFMPMIAGDGPHYGANVKMMGVGHYRLTFRIDPPSKAGFYRHKDKATGVGKWFSTFDTTYTLIIQVYQKGEAHWFTRNLRYNKGLNQALILFKESKKLMMFSFFLHCLTAMLGLFYC